MVQGVRTFTNIARQFSDVGADKHIRHSRDKNLYVRKKASLSGLKDFVSRSHDRHNARGNKQAEGARVIKQALNDQFGDGAGDFAFQKVGHRLNTNLDKGVTGAALRELAEQVKPWEET